MKYTIDQAKKYAEDAKNRNQSTLKEFKIEYTEQTSSRIYIKANSQEEAEAIFYGTNDDEAQNIDWDTADLIGSDYFLDNIEEVK
jgi:hypothetical protein